MFSSKYKIYSSALVGGSLPIAVGTALSLKLKKRKKAMVYCFMGEMTSETGIAHECIKYSRNYDLPIHFIIEDNEKSVCTDTRNTWKLKKLSYEGKNDKFITFYSYKIKVASRWSWKENTILIYEICRRIVQSNGFSCKRSKTIFLVKP